MSIPHTQACQLARANEREELAAYEKEWSGYCRECSATGNIYSIENAAPHGEGFMSIPVNEYCPECIGKGRCPRCGEPSRFYLFRCFTCGWTEGISGAPEVVNDLDCGCFEDALLARQDVERELFHPNYEQY